MNYRRFWRVRLAMDPSATRDPPDVRGPGSAKPLRPGEGGPGTNLINI